MDISIRDSRPSVSAVRLRLFEERIGATLPEDYRQFLLMHNGGVPEPSCFETDADNHGGSSVERFLALDSDTPSDLLAYRLNYQELNSRLALDVIPIAFDIAGNLICLGISGVKRGAVYFWDHELELNQDNSGSTLSFISENFSRFLSGLRPLRSEDTDLLVAIGTSNWQSVERILSEEGACSFVMPGFGMTLLEYAAYFDVIDLARIILIKCNKIDITRAKDIANSRGSMKVLGMLLSY